MSTVPTAVEFAAKMSENGVHDDFWYEAMQEFAKAHVQVALERAADNAEIKWELSDAAYIDRESIINAYPLNQII